MREIKFRAWDGDKMSILVTLKDIIHADKNWVKYCNAPKIGKNLIWMQYTGLNDKTGREIYEGDILKGYGSAIKRFVVSFSEGSFVLYHNFGRWGLLSRMFEIEELPVEVIGNIYENPELCQ